MLKSTRVSSEADTQASAVLTPTSFTKKQSEEVAAALNALTADAFALYLKSKNFHWHVSGPHFRDYHLMLDEQADQIFASTDVLAERVRKIGHPTLKSISQISKLQTINDNNDDFVSPHDMLRELVEDNLSMAEAMRTAHSLCDDVKDVATASLLEVFIDETERRIWFLFEASRGADSDGH
jgi:starvation-inducible DNA-binding protein